MKKIRNALIRAAVACVGLAGCCSAQAAIVYTGMSTTQIYAQRSANDLQFTSSSINFSMATQSAADFDRADFTFAGTGTTFSYALAPRLGSNGTYGSTLARGFFSADNAATGVAMMNDAFQFGVYSIKAINSTTGVSQTATLNYDSNHWPAVPGSAATIAIPAINGSSYATLQGMNATVQHAIGFNSFIGDGVPLSPTEITPSITVFISKVGGGTVYNSGLMRADSTHLVLPANTLEGNATYNYTLLFRNGEHCGGNLGCGTGDPIGYFRDFQTATTGQFSTGPISSGTTSLTLQGGTLSNPTPLIHQREIGQVNGTIGGLGSMAFYEFYWQGGQFRANTTMTGADAQAIYEFKLLDAGGAQLEKLALNAEDSFTADLQHYMPPGTYRIGLESVTEFDPAFTITFDTPVRGNAVPEPGSLSLAGMAAALLLLSRRRRSGDRSMRSLRA